MSKKKINKRLDKLFDEIKSNEADTKPERLSKGRPRVAKQTASLPPITVQPIKRASDSLSGVVARETGGKRDDVKAKVSPSAILTTAFRVDEKHWSTLKVVDESRASIWGSEEQLLVRQVADQLSLAMENARLFQESQSRAEELSAVNQIILSSSQTLELSQLLDTLIVQILELFEFSSGLISLKNEASGKLELNAQRNLPALITQNLQTEGFEGTPCNYVFKSQTPLAIPDLREGAPFDISELVSNGILAYLGTPITVKGQTIGTLCLFNLNPKPMSERTVDLSQTIGRQIGFAIENAQLFHRTQQSESEFRALFSAMEDVIIIYDRNGTYERIAETNPNYLFRPSQEMLGRTIREVLPENLHEPFLTAIRTTLDAGQSQKIEYPLEINDKVYWFFASISKLTENLVFWVARDITERKQNEEALRRRNEYLAASAEIGRLVTSSLELNAIFSRAVNLVKERFGYYHAAIFIVEETGFHAELQEATGEAGEEMKKRGHSLRVGSKSTVGQATESGNAIIINDTSLDPIHKHNPLLPKTRAEAAIPLRIGNRIIGALDIQSTEVNAFTEEDVAILQLLADQIAIGIDNARSFIIAQQAVQEMREIDRLKSQFLANMSHELRTPLNSIIGFARVILKGIDGPITELQQQDLTAIFNSGQHLLGLINDILDLSRIEAGKMELSFGEVNVNDLITSVMSSAGGLIKDKPISLKQEISDNLPTVRADPMRIRQVLFNLLSNASKFTEQGEIIVKAYVDHTATAGQASVIISITDTGPGISPEDQAKLFQPFSQVDASLTRKVGGSGLGLSISHHLVQMHHGRIGIESKQGEGSTFYFTLPIFLKEQKGIRSGDKTVLAIDDDPQIISMYERYLRPKGYQVVTLSNPAQARERVRQLEPFAIILDIMMPGYDGWRVLEDLKSDPETRSVPIIVCSILEEEEKGFSLGAADYLVKPIMEEDLLFSLDHLNNDGSIREVLVIDDDPNDLRLLGTMISNQGRYKPILAEGGQAGWNAILSRRPHAIVLDLFMPEVDGFSIIEKIHENKELRDIPIIVVSSSDLTNEQRSQLQEIGQRLLQKSSLQEQELITTIENALNRIDS